MTAYTWTGAAGDGNFNTAANWSPSGVPGAADTVTISTSAASTITVAASDAVQALTLGKLDTLAVSNGSSLSIGNAATAKSTLSLAGTLALESAGYNTDLIVDSATLTASGGGTILLGNSGSNRIYAGASGDTLVNGDTIAGAGQLGNGSGFGFTNGSTGVVDATDSAQLVFDSTVTATNAGIMEATAGGGLVLQTAINDGTAGRIEARGAEVYLNGATILGGTLSSTAGFSVQVVSTAQLSGVASAVTNAGSLVVVSGDTLSLLGTLDNTGLLSLQSTGYNTDLVAGPTGTLTGTVTLTGGGTLSLGDGSDSNRLYGGNANDTLVNLDNTISGSGTIGLGQLTLVNDGTISATGTANALLIDTSAFTNNALLEGVGSQGLLINAVVSQSGSGTILSNGGTVQLDAATITGGVLDSSNGGSIAVTNTSTIGALSNLGSVELNNGSTLTLLGTITNTGTIGLQSAGYNTDLIAGGATATLTGGGTVVLSDNGSNRIYGVATASVLDNVNNLIEGAGQFGANQLTLVNGAAGIIDATGTSNELSLSTGTTVVNDGLIEATGAAGLALSSTVNDSGGGTLLAAGSTIYLGGADVQGGLLQTSGTGTFDANGQTALDGSAQTVTLKGGYGISNGQTTTLFGTLTNDGTLALNSSGYNTDLIAGSPTVTLTGGGTILLSDNGSNRIYGSATANVLDNVNNIIEGSGQIGANQLTLINGAAGVIDATGTNDGITLSTGTTVVNDGLIEATGAAGLALSSTVNDSGGGTLLAARGTIYLSGADVQGGLLQTSGTGTFDANGQTTLDGSAQTVTLKGGFGVSNGDTTTLFGTLTDEGTLALNSSGYNTDLIAGSPTVTLTGGGTILLSDNGSNRIYGSATANVLDNVNDTIEGSGQLGAGQLTLVNGKAGIIDATGSNAQLTISTGALVTNGGLIESTGTAGLSISSAVSNSTGTILAASSTIYLGGADIEGGLLKTTGSGAFVANSQTTIDGSAHAVTLLGSLDVADGQTITLLGTLANQGTLGLQSTGYSTDLVVDSATLTLTGGGVVALTDNGSNRIYGAATADVLDNLNNTIEGSGQIGLGQLTLVNAGTISSTGTSGLTISLGSTGTNTATGQLLGAGTGGLSLQDGTYTNAGLIEAENGSSVTFSSNATLTNDSAAGELSGGTYAAVAAGSGATLGITGAAVKTLAADLILSGVGSSITFGGTAIEASLSVIDAHAQLQVLGDRSYSSTLAISNAGTVALAGGDFAAKSLVDRATSLLSGFGTVAAALNSAGVLTATGGTLDLKGRDSISGTVSGSGTLALDDNRFTLDDTAPVTVSEIALINRASLAISDSLTYAGIFNINGVSSLTGTGTFTNTGLFEQTGRGTATIADPFASSGTISTISGGTLAFTDGLANTGLILDNGGFTDTAALTGGALDVGARGSSAVLGSAAGAANSTLSTLTIGGGTLNTSSTTLTVTGDYVNTAAGTGNSYNPFAGVTGTIDGQGTQLGVVGVNGTTIQDVNGTLTIAITAGHNAYFEIENTGASGSAALRGALQTTVNGGTINGRDLSGSGVTAANFGPIAAGSSSGTYTIDYKGGTITNEAIHLSSDFANVAGLTIDIVAQTTATALPSAACSVPDLDASRDWLVVSHHG